MTGLDANEGRGCFHCATGIPIEKIKSKYGTVELCLECVLLWFPNRSLTWWERRHAPFSDHFKDAIARAKREKEQAMREAQVQESADASRKAAARDLARV